MCRGEARTNYCEDRDIAPALTLTAGITKYLPCGSIGGWGGEGRGGYTIGVGCSSVLSSRGMVQILGSNFPQMALDINLSVI